MKDAGGSSLMQTLMRKLWEVLNPLVEGSDEAQIGETLRHFPPETADTLGTAAGLTPGTPDYQKTLAGALESVLQKIPADASIRLQPNSLEWVDRDSMRNHTFWGVTGAQVFRANFGQQGKVEQAIFLLSPGEDAEHFQVIVDTTTLPDPAQAVLELHKLFGQVPGANFYFLSGPIYGGGPKAGELAEHALWPRSGGLDWQNRVNLAHAINNMKPSESERLNKLIGDGLDPVLRDPDEGPDLFEWPFEPSDVAGKTVGDEGLFAQLLNKQPYYWQVDPLMDEFEKVEIPTDNETLRKLLNPTSGKKQ